MGLADDRRTVLCIFFFFMCMSDIVLTRVMLGRCRQNKALDHLSDDVDELNSRVKGANQRTRRLLGK